MHTKDTRMCTHRHTHPHTNTLMHTSVPPHPRHSPSGAASRSATMPLKSRPTVSASKYLNTRTTSNAVRIKFARQKSCPLCGRHTNTHMQAHIHTHAHTLDFVGAHIGRATDIWVQDHGHSSDHTHAHIQKLHTPVVLPVDTLISEDVPVVAPCGVGDVHGLALQRYVTHAFICYGPSFATGHQ